MRIDPLREEWYQLCDRWSQNGYESLTNTEKLWLNTRSLIDSINNGGLISYFYNSGADRYADCVDALRQLQAYDVLQQVQQLAELFGDPVPTSVERRNEIIASWPEYGHEHEISTRVDDVLMPLMNSLDERLEQYLTDLGNGLSPEKV